MRMRMKPLKFIMQRTRRVTHMKPHLATDCECIPDLYRAPGAGKVREIFDASVKHNTAAVTYLRLLESGA